MSENFAANLKSLCAEHGSISQICRDIGVNRQQFNRYLNGSSLPSAHNMRRIARHFNLTEAELFAETTSFERMLKGALPQIGRTPTEAFLDPFRDQQKNLRRYVGFYHSIFLHAFVGRKDLLFVDPHSGSGWAIHDTFQGDSHLIR